MLAVCGAAIGKNEMERFQVKVYAVDNMPFGSGFERFLCEKEEAHDYVCELKMRKSMQLFRSRVTHLTTVLKDWNPEVIFVDILYIADLIIIKKWVGVKNSAKIILIRTKPSLRKQKYTLPSVFQTTYKNELQASLLWSLYNFKKLINRYWDFIRFQGYDDVTILHKARKVLLGTSSALSISWKNVIGVHVGDYPQLVLIPREFEFGDYIPAEKEVYLGFQYEITQSDLSIEAEAVIQKTLMAKSRGDKIITISFGSLYTGFKKEIRTILQKLSRALSNLSDNVFIIIIGKFKNISSLFQGLEYSKLEESPLVKILEISDLHICHGGINTIKDCLFSRTPMLVFPLNKNWDQPGNAAKVEYHRLGMASSANVSIEGLHSRLVFLLNDFSEVGFQKFITLENKKYIGEASFAN